MPIIPLLRKLMQEDSKEEVSLDCTPRHFLKKKKSKDK